MGGFELEVSSSRCCKGCLEANLVESIKIARCSKCGFLYCVHFASNIDPQYCTECLSDVSLIKETVVKTYEHYNEETDMVTQYKRKARSIRMEGLDWLFAQRKILTLNDDELELAIEYHRGILAGMLKEREERRIAHAHRFAGIQMPKSMSTTSTEKTVVKRTKTVKSDKATANANALLQGFLASGMKMEDILKMFEGALKK